MLLIRNNHLMIASVVVFGIGLVLRLMAEDWATIEFTTQEGVRSSTVNHAKQLAFEWVGLALNYGGAGVLAFSLYARYFGKKKAWRI